MYNDIEMYLLMFDPYIHDPNIPDSAIEQLLMSVNNAQSPGIQRIVSTLRSPDGRPVCPLSDDTTNIGSPSSNDPQFQKDVYSGKRGKKNCVLFGTLTDVSGSVVAVRPAAHISTTPTGGDGVSMAAQLAVADKTGHDSGFTRLLCGTANICAAL